MLFFILIWVLKPIDINASIKDSYNLIRNNSPHYINYDMINIGDYDILDKKGLFTVKHKGEIFEELNKPTNREYGKESFYNNLNPNSFKILEHSDYVNEIGFVIRIRPKRHSPQKRDVTSIDTEYNYEQLLNEYYMETSNEDTSNGTYHFDRIGTNNGVLNSMQIIMDVHQKCSKENIIFKTFKCIFNDYGQIQPLHFLFWRCWKIICIWTIIYIIVAVPLWCTRGLCCCCLFCDFFKPHQSIMKAKRYLIRNPPGLMTIKHHEILYEPSRSERESYEEFEHLMRTI